MWTGGLLTLESLQTVAVFQYLRDPMVMERMDAVASGILDDLRLIELHTQGGDG